MTQFVLLICVAINYYCQVLINFAIQNMVGSVTSIGFCGLSGGGDKIVLYQNVGVHGAISLRTKHI